MSRAMNPSREEKVKALNERLFSVLKDLAASNDQYSLRPQISLPQEHVEPSLFGFAHDVFSLPLSSDRKIYIGPKRVACREAKRALHEANVAGIVNCTPCVPNVHRPEITYCQVPVLDEEGSNISVYLDGATYFMNCILTSPATMPIRGGSEDEDESKKGGSVLVHCEQGISRSATVVIAYLMRYHNMPIDEAYGVCKTRRHKVNPNQGFWKQLQEYGTKLNMERRDITTGCENGAPGTLLGELKDLVLQSNAIFATCRELSIRQMCNNTHFSGIFTRLKSAEQMKQILNVCIDFVWGRGILDVDIDWMIFICRHLLPRDFKVLPEEAVEDLLTNPESDFCQAWAGEIYQKDVGRVLEGVYSDTPSHKMAALKRSA
jgi:hypothetical protein